jgi:putative membrane protein
MPAPANRQSAQFFGSIAFMVPFGWRIVVNALALWIVDGLWSSIWLVGHADGLVGKILTYLVTGLVLAVVNSVVKPLAKILAFPLYILTLGLFGLVINAAMLGLVSWISGLIGVGLHVDGFWTAVWAGLVLAILTALISIPFRRSR